MISLHGLSEFIAGLGPSIAGGIARYFQDTSDKGHKFNWKEFGIQVFIAGFVGWITISTTNEIIFFEGRQQLQGAVVGVSGFLSPNILTFIKTRVWPKIEKKWEKKL